MSPLAAAPFSLLSRSPKSGGHLGGKTEGGRGGEGNHGFGFHAATPLYTDTTTYLLSCRESEALEYYVVYKH